ncbi:hypothetical protein ACF0H5_005085 [Mactra antiquata]
MGNKTLLTTILVAVMMWSETLATLEITNQDDFFSKLLRVNDKRSKQVNGPPPKMMFARNEENEVPFGRINLNYNADSNIQLTNTCEDVCADFNLLVCHYACKIEHQVSYYPHEFNKCLERCAERYIYCRFELGCDVRR